MSDNDDIEVESDADKRAHHNALERKRRDHIKDSFHSLRDSVPSLQGEKIRDKMPAIHKRNAYKGRHPQSPGSVLPWERPREWPLARGEVGFSWFILPPHIVLDRQVMPSYSMPDFDSPSYMPDAMDVSIPWISLRLT
ncbi:protein max isoform X6 [Dromiciops gliroides]|uniref:protein max isoform X6 n=1 Tax=Dromiciops gliroides TaxID=33562 RepID=UPI001CC6475E|nr:protein max isoform X6 [Dromiciops gliroides]